MWNWRWPRRKRPPAQGGTSGETRLTLEQRAQGLQLDLEERERTLADLRRQVERMRLGEDERRDSAVRAQIERLIAASATPITQLHTQAYLIDVEGRPVAARDVLANARGLLRAFE